MHKRTKALDIPQKVKDAVWERDGHRCILCGSLYAMPNAHYIPRSHGGLGIEQNIVTLCLNCHFRYDNTDERIFIAKDIKSYLEEKYGKLDTSKLIYKKGE